jgi:hypothetical protein
MLSQSREKSQVFARSRMWTEENSRVGPALDINTTYARALLYGAASVHCAGLGWSWYRCDSVRIDANRMALGD